LTLERKKTTRGLRGKRGAGTGEEEKEKAPKDRYEQVRILNPITPRGS